MTNIDKIAAIRRELPATSKGVYLNTGTCGPVSRAVANTMAAVDERELTVGRIAPNAWQDYMAALADLRGSFARLLGADADEIALTHHTTDGMNIGIWGLDWRPGDELITTNNEHEGGLIPAYNVARRLGVSVKIVDIGLGDGDVTGLLQAAMTPRTRLLSLSHVSWMSGARLPLAEIVAMAHRQGALVLVDGAQSLGAIPVDVHALGADMYTATGQKWLCGPEGVGALYVRRAVLDQVQPTFAGYGTIYPDMDYDYQGNFRISAAASRYEIGTSSRSGNMAMLAGLRWLEEDVTWPWAHARIAELAGMATEMLDGLPGVTVLTPPSRAGLISFTIAEQSPEAVVAVAGERGVWIRWLPKRGWLRVSTGFFNSEEDLNALCDALRAA